MILKNIVLQFIKAYQYGISPFLGLGCRFHPTCSVYAYEAVARYGLGKGMWLSVKRILRCHPFHAGGVDPVPTHPIKPEG